MITDWQHAHEDELDAAVDSDDYESVDARPAKDVATFTYASGARGHQIGQSGPPFYGPCGDGAAWSQSGPTYIHEAQWGCDRGKNSPWIRAQATRGSDIAPEYTPQKFPGNAVSEFRDFAGPVPGWGTVPLDLAGPQ